LNNVVALLAERREEIKAVTKLYKEMSDSLGAESTLKVLCEAIAAEARASGRKVAPEKREEAGLHHFANLFRSRGVDGGMGGITHEIKDNRLFMTIGRCDYCQLYRSSGLPAKLSEALCCGREPHYAQGYDERLKLVLQEAQGERDRSCNLVYEWAVKPASANPETVKKSLRVTN